MSKALKLAMIGLDTSHSIAFSKRIQGSGAKNVRGIRVTRCLRFPSPFQSEPLQDERQKVMEGLGIEVTHNFQHAVEGAEGILLEINDPAQHWKYFKKVADLGLPIFIDKPLAKNLSDAKKIVALTRQNGLKVWESSSLRFSPDLSKAIALAGKAELVNIYGAMGTAPAGSSLIWYGCHTFQMLNQIMGNQALKVHATQGQRGVVTTVEYADGRRGVVESISGLYNYGGRIHGEKGIVEFKCEGDVYSSLMPALRNFFVKGIIPVPLQNSYAVQYMLEAASKSIQLGKAISIKEKL